MTSKSNWNSRDLYIDVLITNAHRRLVTTTALDPGETSTSLVVISKILHKVADQIIEGAPVGSIDVTDGLVASWQVGGSTNDSDVIGGGDAQYSPGSSISVAGDVSEIDTHLFRELEELEIAQVAGFRLPKPQPVARASTKKNARPIYRYFPFNPGTFGSAGSWEAAVRALKVFAVLHAAHRGPEGLEVEDLLPLFFRSSSDLITYREGWKAGRFWSVKAFLKAVHEREKHTNGLISEHVMPRSQTLRRALAMEDIQQAVEFVWDMSFECVVTADENNELTRRDKKRPRDTIWVFENGPWERYAGTNIQILDVECNGQKWLSDEDRESLRRLKLLAEWDASFLKDADPEILAQWSKYIPVEKR
ncbi:MAG: hypothetical protein KME12_24465 [Trichocoleus desertorum ATA4-8-CV12]|jgi:hypothetical protein|nr:hypothetical protein [Trichocoleus desertorum ATA4-8-CV12]